MRQEQARRGLERFTTYTFPRYDTRWFHRVMFEAVDALLDGKLPNGKRKLLVEAPPRHGKTEICSRRTPAYALQRNPDERIIAVTYGMDLARKNARDVKRIIATPTYRDLRPSIRLAERREAKVAVNQAQMFELPEHEGQYLAAGIGTAITGFGATLFCLDDLYKNREQADSETYRKKVIESYIDDISTRDEGDAKFLCTFTRWHSEDLAGWLMENEGDQWHVIRLLAELDEEPGDYDPRKQGEFLWPEKFGPGYYAERRGHARSWESLFQQRPAPPEGGIFKKHLWQRWAKLPKHFDTVVQSWDFTFKKTTDGSFVVGQVWGRKGADFYLLYQIRARLGFVQSCDALVSVTDQYPDAHGKLIEAKANGDAVIDQMGRRVSGLIAVEPRGSKEERAWAVQPYQEARNIWLPAAAPWVDGFIERTAAFPNTAFDDEVDAMTQAIRYLDGGGISALRDLAQM